MKFRNLKNKYFFYNVEDGNNGAGGGNPPDIIPEEQETIEETVNDENNPINDKGTTDGIPQIEEEIKPFNPLEMEFEEEELQEKVNMTFGDYNLEKYKDVIKFDDPKVSEAFNKMAESYKEKGFSQEQIEFLIDTEIENAKNRKPQKVTAEEMKNKLDIKTKKEWKNLTGDLTEIFNTTNQDYAKHLESFASNPTQMNIFRGIAEFYKNKYSSGISDTLKQRDPIPKATGVYTAMGAAEKLNAALRTRNFGDYGDMYGYAEHLLNNVKDSEKAEALKLLGSYTKNKK